MKRNLGPYVAAGVTAFCVIAGAILVFFAFFHASVLWELCAMVAYILRPIFMGMVIAFLLLPIHRTIFQFMLAMTSNARLADHRNVRFLNILAVIFSLLFAFILLYLLMAMALPQVYLSVVGLFNAFPDYIVSVQSWLLTFLEDNPDIQAFIMPLYNQAALSLEQWLNSDILPNLESITTTMGWLKESIFPNITGVVSNVSAILISTLLLLKDILIALIVSVYVLLRKD